jgi:hypothetical protein
MKAPLPRSGAPAHADARPRRAPGPPAGMAAPRPCQTGTRCRRRCGRAFPVSRGMNAPLPRSGAPARAGARPRRAPGPPLACVAPETLPHPGRRKAPGGGDEIHPVLAQGPSGDRSRRRRDRRGADRSGARGRGGRGPGRAARWFHARPGAEGRGASRCRSLAALPGGDRPGRKADHLRCAECPRRHHRGRRPSRQLCPRDRHDDPGRQDPRHRIAWHDAVGTRAGPVGRTCRHRRAALGRGRPALRRLAGGARACPHRPGDRHRRDPEPARRAGGAGDRPRSGGARPRHAQTRARRQRAGGLSLPDPGDHRRRHGRRVPAVLRPADPRGHKRAVPAMAAGSAARHRPPADFGPGRYHQFLHP